MHPSLLVAVVLAPFSRQSDVIFWSRGSDVRHKLSLAKAD
jgi:hypothetical protein